MSDTLNLTNSIWPNGIKVDSGGHAVFYPLGTKKINVPTSYTQWPKGNKLISPFVYQDDKLVGFVDTKALKVSKNTTIQLLYEHIEANFPEIEKGQLQIHAPNATIKKVTWKNSGKEDIPSEVQYKYKGCKTVDDVKTVDTNYQTTDIVDRNWSEPLWDLEQGNSDGTNKGGMFYNCFALKSFSSDLPSLKSGQYMFYYNELASFNADLPSLENGYYMFSYSKLNSFSSDLSSLTDGSYMFYRCGNLTSFSSDLSSLEDGTDMFSNCKLDTASVQNIADTINTYNGIIHIRIGNSSPNEQEENAFNTIASKGWTVYVNGSQYTPTSPAAITMLDEYGEETTTPIPFWAKPVQTDEEHAKYVDANGNFYNILGGQFIYGDNLETYGMFTCEEDAATQMGLTKIEK